MASITNEFTRTFLASEEAAAIRVQLELMMNDPVYNTRSYYSPAQIEDVSFADKHLKYLSVHPKLKSSEYLANLRLMTRARK